MSEVIYSNEEIDGAISILDQLLIECNRGDLDQHISPALIISRDGLRQLAAAQRRIAILEKEISDMAPFMFVHGYRTGTTVMKIDQDGSYHAVPMEE